MRSGFVVYENPGIAGTVQAYLRVPPHARVRVWDQPGKRGWARGHGERCPPSCQSPGAAAGM